MAILIYCRPLRQAEPKQERSLTNIELVLDVSGSMTSPFGNGSRYDASIAAMNEFTSRRKGDAFGLAIFGNEVLAVGAADQGPFGHCAARRRSCGPSRCRRSSAARRSARPCATAWTCCATAAKATA